MYSRKIVPAYKNSSREKGAVLVVLNYSVITWSAGAFAFSASSSNFFITAS